MRFKSTAIGWWMFAAAFAQGEALAQAEILRAVPLREPASSWPWLALGAVLVLLGVIARFARRHLPFGGRV